MDLSFFKDNLEALAQQVDSPALAMAALIARYVLPVLCIWLVVRCGVSLLRGRIEREAWGRLTLPNGDYGVFHHWENIVGRSRSSDVVLQSPTVSRSHAAFLRDERGNWSVQALSTKNEVSVNGVEVPLQQAAPVKHGDVVSMGGVEVTFT
ncbi:MAG: FHA domain-containing protein, partial [Oscillospiraceae bacterium]|nr:FHA domain-containing protein [Oscillospiraceae bacterium]